MTERTGHHYSSLARQAARIDLWLLVAVLGLCAIGLIMVMSTSESLAEAKKHSDAMHYLKRQAVFMAAGLGVMVLARFVPVLVYRKLVYLILGIALAALTAVLIPGLGATAGGATRWLALGPLAVQPAEAAKLALVIYLAYSMSRKVERMDSFTVGVLPHLLVCGVMIAVSLLQRDLGMAAMMGLIMATMLFVGGARFRHLAAVAAVALPLGSAMIFMADYRLARLTVFLDPWQDPMGGGYQIIHSFFAFASGGVFGAGLGSSLQKLHYLPESHTDFILSILAEEIGLIGVLALLALYGIIAWRGLKWSLAAEDPFTRYLACGLTVLIFAQALVNMAVVMGLLPTTGLTLPLVSYGGSSLIVNLMAAGMLLRMSADLRRE